MNSFGKNNTCDLIVAALRIYCIENSNRETDDGNTCGNYASVTGHISGSSSSSSSKREGSAVEGKGKGKIDTSLMDAESLFAEQACVAISQLVTRHPANKARLGNWLVYCLV